MLEKRLQFNLGGQGSYPKWTVELRRTFEQEEQSFHEVRASAFGFIKSDQGLKQVLIDANKLVVDELGLNHQIVATPLLKAIQAIKKSDMSSTLTFQFNGQSYEISISSMGTYGKLRKFFGPNTQKLQYISGWVAPDKMANRVMGSPFNDHIFTDFEFTIVNIATGKSLNVDGLTPHLGYRYGFWQTGSFQIDPKKVSKFFNLNSRAAIF